MPSKLELTGMRYGRLLVLHEAGQDSFRAWLWSCQCDCGKVTVVRGSSLKQGTTASCGCGVGLAAKEHFTTHGMSRTVLFGRWQAMIARTSNPKNAEWRNYGGRGITVCEPWRRFENFAADMANSFDPSLELDRIDNDLGYCPENCRWATRRTQQLNKRTNHRVEWEGRDMTVQEWGEFLGLKPNSIVTRLRRGWSIERALTTGVASTSLTRLANA